MKARNEGAALAARLNEFDARRSKLDTKRKSEAERVAEALKSPEVQKVLRDLYGIRPRVMGE